ncbi:uncharacterized protein CTRU02_211350 [Colletotrichum truncatum]|uniref:Uncharacterized protein n=1 Tax=Colletotrichum truncatum TaxID=5467 RepID=A0ACC3YSV6_COLTU|nr:uncharacterized protein CTRU02_02126 [Colletotrichum truncatum]KAF6799255.1 hypothetical protein CTRU02_02126 [Colletotrichum truncatum]
MSFANVYTHRKVAENAAKGCDVCYRATSSVLVAEEKKDFFYVCPSHLKDKNFCSPIIDKEAAEAKKKKELEEEIERVKKEYEEKQKKKKEKDAKDKDADKEKEKEKDKDKDNDNDKSKDEKKAEDEKKTDDAKSTDKDGAGTSTPSTDDEPRVFALHKNFYGMRLEKKRQLEIAKRNRERLQQPSFFPSVPKGAPGS